MLHGRWLPENRARLEAFIDAHARGSAGFDAARPPIVLFDWDNTAMRGDIGDLAFSWALTHDAFAPLPPAGGFASLGPLRAELAAELDGECSRSGLSDRCRRLLSRIALRGRDLEGEDAFTSPVGPTFKPSYALLSQLYVGLTHDEVAAIGRAALTQALAQAPGSRAQVAGTDVETFARITPELRELTALLREHGFELYVVSASHQALVEVAAAELGFARDHVVGMRPNVGGDGRYAAGFTDPTDGLADGPITTYDVGKRIWALREIYGVRGAALFEEAPALAPTAVFGDADTDYAMLDWASELALLFDRGYPRVSARAAERPDRWVVQPVLEAP